MDKYVNVLDIGTTGVRTIIARLGKDGRPRIIGKSTVPCKGVKKFSVVDGEALKYAIELVVRQASDMAGVNASSVYVSIRGVHVNSIRNSETIILSSDEQEITPLQLGKLLDRVAAVDIYEDEKLIDIVPVNYYLENETQVNDPIGLHASSIRIEADIVLGHYDFIKSITSCIKAAGLEVDGFIPSSVSMMGLLPEEDQDIKGILLIDIGGSVSDYTIYHRNKPVLTGSIPAGGEHITNDLAQIFSMSPSEAECLKKDYPLAMKCLVTNNVDVSIFSLKNGTREIIKISELVEVMEARLENLFSKIKESLQEEAIVVEKIGQIMLTGDGIIKFKGLDDMIDNVFAIPYNDIDFCRITGMKSTYTLCWSMVEYIAQQIPLGRKPSNVNFDKKVQKDGETNQLIGFFRKIKKYFTDLIAKFRK